MGSTTLSPAPPNGKPFVSLNAFQIAMWTMTGVATLFLASRFTVRMFTKGRLMVNDYFLVLALPVLFIGAALLQSALGLLYQYEDMMLRGYAINPAAASPRLTAAIEMLWIAIFSVKFCFLAQFKFYKPPYTYVSVHFTRYYWVTVGICVSSFVYALIQPIVNRYSSSTDPMPMEMAVTALDITTDLLVISIPILLICMANFTRSHTLINAWFKSLSICTIAMAAPRLALQYDGSSHRIRYVTLTFWLVIEAAVAIIMASISSYRVVLLDYLAERRMQHSLRSGRPKTHRPWGQTISQDRSDTSRSTAAPTEAELGYSLSELPVLGGQARKDYSTPVD